MLRIVIEVDGLPEGLSPQEVVDQFVLSPDLEKTTSEMPHEYRSRTSSYTITIVSGEQV